jgi:SH3 domain-containing YSC84-like protein 1
MLKLAGKKLRCMGFLAVFVLMAGSFLFAETDGKLDLKVDAARIVLQEMKEMPEEGIPEDLLHSWSGIAIYPSVLKAAFGFGGMGGTGVMLRRDKETGEWSPPVFSYIGGASFGFQIGGQATDLILVIMSERGMMSLSGDNVTLGGDASVSAGPVGRNAQIETTVAMNTGIFSYSRSKGLFAGISLKGSVVGPQKDLVKKYYGEDITAEKVLFSGTVMPSAAGQKLIEQLRQY